MKSCFVLYVHKGEQDNFSPAGNKRTHFIVSTTLLIQVPRRRILLLLLTFGVS